MSGSLVVGGTDKTQPLLLAPGVHSRAAFLVGSEGAGCGEGSLSSYLAVSSQLHDEASQNLPDGSCTARLCFRGDGH